ncbi:MAG: hypothetical protein ACLFNU_11765 [Bacteroidales bacterium]
MKSLTTWLLNASLLLVLTGMIGHEVIPHHHHVTAGQVDTCCESHEQEEESDHDSVCNVLADIHKEERRIELGANETNSKHQHNNSSHTVCSHCSLSTFSQALSKKQLYIPQAEHSNIYHTITFSFRGPPIS